MCFPDINNDDGDGDALVYCHRHHFGLFLINCQVIVIKRPNQVVALFQ